MSSFAADVIGLLGSALFIGAFAYANLAKQLNKVGFNLANLLGAILLLVSLSVSFNLAAFVLESAWAVIAAAGLVMALRKSPSRSREVSGVGLKEGDHARPPPPPPASGGGDA